MLVTQDELLALDYATNLANTKSVNVGIYVQKLTAGCCSYWCAVPGDYVPPNVRKNLYNIISPAKEVKP